MTLIRDRDCWNPKSTDDVLKCVKRKDKFNRSILLKIHTWINTIPASRPLQLLWMSKSLISGYLYLARVCSGNNCRWITGISIDMVSPVHSWLHISVQLVEDTTLTPYTILTLRNLVSQFTDCELGCYALLVH